MLGSRVNYQVRGSPLIRSEIGMRSDACFVDTRVPHPNLKGNSRVAAEYKLRISSFARRAARPARLRHTTRRIATVIVGNACARGAMDHISLHFRLSDLTESPFVRL